MPINLRSQPLPPTAQRIANSFVFKEPLFNYSADFPFLWDEVTPPIDDAQNVKASWLRLARQYRLEETNVEPMITLRATDNWIEFTVRYVVDYRKRCWMRDHLFTRLLEEVDKSNNRIRLASTTVELVPGSTLDVHLSSMEPRRD
jgi:hypothetical protein